MDGVFTMVILYRRNERNKATLEAADRSQETSSHRSDGVSDVALLNDASRSCKAVESGSQAAVYSQDQMKWSKQHELKKVCFLILLRRLKGGYAVCFGPVLCTYYFEHLDIRLKYLNLSKICKIKVKFWAHFAVNI